MKSEKVYKPSEFAELLKVTVRTLQRWDREGILLAYRTPTNRRFYTHEQYLSYGESAKTRSINRVLTAHVEESFTFEQLKDHLQDLVTQAQEQKLCIERIRLEGQVKLNA